MQTVVVESEKGGHIVLASLIKQVTKERPAVSMTIFYANQSLARNFCIKQVSFHTLQA